MKSIIVTGGGTGGHLFPAIALGDELMALNYETHLITDIRCAKYLTSDLRLIPHVINFRLLSNSIVGKIGLLLSLVYITFKLMILLSRIKPAAIIGFGGYPTFPPLLAALFLRIPIVIYEQNAFIGKTNKFFLKFAAKIALAYQETKGIENITNDKKVIIGSIIRESVKKLTIKDNFTHQPFRIFIFGGSQGAKIFSILIPEVIKKLILENPDIKISVTQQASIEDQVNIDKIYKDLGISYKLAVFFNDMDRQYANHELVISRAGAATISELSYIGLPGIFIPLPSAADNHQFYNAKALEDNGAGWCFEQKAISVEKLANQILLVIKNRDILTQVSSNLLKRKNDGSKILADILERMIS